MAIELWRNSREVKGRRGIFARLRDLFYRVLMRVDILVERARVARVVRSDADRQKKKIEAVRKEANRADSIKKKYLRRELSRVERAISLRLTLLEFAHWSRPNRNGRYKISRIRFAERVVTPNHVFLRVDTVRLPRGRGITSQELMQQDVLDELSLAVGAPVSVERHYERGFWFEIDLGGKLSSIPSLVERSEISDLMPKVHGPLDVPLGIGNYRKFFHINIEDCPHLLIAGATGFGKSMLVHNIITWIIENHTNENVRLVLCDLKGGAELSRYDGIPHLWEHSGGGRDVEARVFTRSDDVLAALQGVLYEVERRLQLFAGERVSKLSSWNRKHHNRRLPRILVLVDEIQNAMLNPKIRAEIEPAIVDVASRSRATGVHIIISTQRPSTDVITGLIKANIPARIAFNCFSIHDSRTILDTTEAAGLGRAGLLVFKGAGNRHFRCQAPFLSEGLIEEIIKRTIEGVGGRVEARDVGIPDLIRWAIEKNGCKFTIDEVYREFRGHGVSYPEVRDVWAEFAVKGNTIELDGRRFQFRKRDNKLVEIGVDGVPLSELTVLDMARWAIEKQNGAFSIRKTVAHFRRDLTEAQFRQVCREYDGNVLTVDGVDYMLTPGNGGNRPRRWVKV